MAEGRCVERHPALQENEPWSRGVERSEARVDTGPRRGFLERTAEGCTYPHAPRRGAWPGLLGVKKGENTSAQPRSLDLREHIHRFLYGDLPEFGFRRGFWLFYWTTTGPPGFWRGTGIIVPPGPVLEPGKSLVRILLVDAGPVTDLKVMEFGIITV